MLACGEPIRTLESHGYKVTCIHSDGEGAISAIADIMASRGVSFNPAGLGQTNVPTVERKIRQVKLTNEFPPATGVRLIARTTNASSQNIHLMGGVYVFMMHLQRSLSRRILRSTVGTCCPGPAGLKLTPRDAMMSAFAETAPSPSECIHVTL